MLIDLMDIEMCGTTDEILELCVSPMKNLLTKSEKDMMANLVDENDEDMIRNLGGGDVNKAKEQMLTNYLLYHLQMSAKTCILYVFPSGKDLDSDEGFLLVGSYYQVVIEFALQLIRQSLLNKSLSDNGNGTIKSISSNGRAVTFMSTVEAMEQAELPNSLKQRLPKPKRVRVL
jgi:hypothetical protein